MNVSFLFWALALPLLSSTGGKKMYSRIIKLIALAAVVGWVPSAFSADYYWCDGNASCAVHHASASAACASYTSASFYAKFELTENDSYGNVYVRCGLHRKTDDSRFDSITFERRGDSCPTDHVYNATKGECTAPLASDGSWCSAPGQTTKTFIMSGGNCVAPTDASLADQCKAYSKNPITSESEITTWKWPENSSIDLRNPQKAVNKLGCEVQLLEDISCKTLPAQVVKPYMQADGTLSEPSIIEKTMKCRTRAVLNGNVAPQPTGAPTDHLCVGDECEITPIAETSEKEPCTYMVDAEGRQSCVSWDFKGKEGAEQCGTIAGVFSCKGDYPTATGKGIAIGTTVETESLPDGKTKTTKTDTAQITKCIGTAACVTTNTTNKSVTIKGGDGKVESQSGTCTGALCPTGTNPDADGDGLGDCTENCEEENPEFVGPPSELPELDEEEAPDFSESIGVFADRIQEAQLIAAATSIQIPSGGSCQLPDAQTFFGVIRVQGFCDSIDSFLGPLLNLILAMWAFLALRVLLSA